MFDQTSKTFWENKDNHRIYADWLGIELGYKNIEDWYKINVDLISNNYGGGLLSGHYYNTPSQFVKSIYPEYNWIEWKFTQTKRGFWKDINNHKKYMNWLKIELGYKNMEDWYNINVKILHKNDGYGPIQFYNNSLIQLLKSVYPEYNWIEWKFTCVPTNFWEDKKNHRKYADWLGIELGYKTMEDWYKVDNKLIKKNNGCGLLHIYNNSPSQFVTTIYPEYIGINQSSKKIIRKGK